MVATCAPPQEPAPTVYALLLNFIEDIMHNPVDKIALKYVHFERILLEIMGFGLSLDYCVVTGDTTDLTYISPKSGRAVSTAAAQPYKHKLLPLPQCLKTEATPLYFSEFVVALETLGYFWQHHALPTALPSARLLLIEFLTRNAA
jgi:DNA repair protein RecO (recombination protein O)